MTPLRTLALLAPLALGLMAAPAAAQEYEPGHSRGAADAPMTIIEYGSFTCGTCKYFHDELMPVIEPHIEAGTVRFVFREVLRNDLDTALASLARCVDSGAYFDVASTIFTRQDEIIEAAGKGEAMSEFITIGTPYGIADAAAFNACYGDMNIRFELLDVEESASEYDLHGTPTLVLNGEEKYVDQDFQSAEAFSAFLDNALAGLNTAAADHAH